MGLIVRPAARALDERFGFAPTGRSCDSPAGEALFVRKGPCRAG